MYINGQLIKMSNSTIWFPEVINQNNREKKNKNSEYN